MIQEPGKLTLFSKKSTDTSTGLIINQFFKSITMWVFMGLGNFCEQGVSLVSQFYLTIFSIFLDHSVSIYQLLGKKTYFHGDTYQQTSSRISSLRQKNLDRTGICIIVQSIAVIFHFLLNRVHLFALFFYLICLSLSLSLSLSFQFCFVLLFGFVLFALASCGLSQNFCNCGAS